MSNDTALDLGKVESVLYYEQQAQQQQQQLMPAHYKPPLPSVKLLVRYRRGEEQIIEGERAREVLEEIRKSAPGILSKKFF